MPVIKLNMTESEIQHVLKWARGVPVAPLVKHMLLERSGYHEGTSSTLPGPSTIMDPAVPSQGTTRVLAESGTDIALSSTPEEEKEKNKKGEKSARRARLAPLDLTERVLAALNASAGTGYEHDAVSHRTIIQRCLDRGLSEADLLTIVRKMTAQWKDSPKMVGYLRPSTLFGSKAEEYLGMAEKADSRPQQSLPATSAQRGLGDDEGYENGTW